MTYKAPLKSSALATSTSLVLVVLAFLSLTLPLAFDGPTGGRSAERQGFTAGIIRIYCFDPGHSIVNGPQIHFGKNAFNIEWTGFEWIQGLVARSITPESCDSVEPVGKIFSITFSVMALVFAALLCGALTNSTHLGWPSVAAAAFLAFDELWLRYAGYTMIENRALALMLAAIFFSVKRKSFLSSTLWALVFVHKAQIFLFGFLFWLVFELFSARAVFISRARIARSFIINIRLWAGIVAAGVVGLAWYWHSFVLARESDLPWIVHTGPKQARWYFGNWSERWSLDFWKGLFFVWSRSLYLPYFVAFTALLAPKECFRAFLTRLIRCSAPFLTALFAYEFIFYNVFKFHEYYALPINVVRAILIGMLIHSLASLENPRRRLGTALFVVLLLGTHASLSLNRYFEYVKQSRDPLSSIYHANWGKKIFPDAGPQDLVVIAPVGGTGRDLLHLYLAKARGFTWCAENTRYAPRKFWKEHGIKFVAWQTGTKSWVVRSIDEELAIARKNKWSSDVDDAWAGSPMKDWAKLASSTGADACVALHGDVANLNPRRWHTLSPRSDRD